MNKLRKIITAPQNINFVVMMILSLFLIGYAISSFSRINVNEWQEFYSHFNLLEIILIDTFRYLIHRPSDNFILVFDVFMSFVVGITIFLFTLVSRIIFSEKTVQRLKSYRLLLIAGYVISGILGLPYALVMAIHYDNIKIISFVVEVLIVFMIFNVYKTSKKIKEKENEQI